MRERLSGGGADAAEGNGLSDSIRPDDGEEAAAEPCGVFAELKLAEKYAEKDEKGNIKWTERGTFPYRDADAAAGYQKERRALGMTQVEDDFTVQHAPVPEKITPMQLEALEKFIVFGGEG